MSADRRLEHKATNIRIDILKMLNIARSGHTGGSLSCVEILVELFYEEMKHDPGDPALPSRDRFILSKGHAAPAIYAVLADSGYFDKKELLTLRRLGTVLQGHPDSKKTRGIEVSTGSLGQGLSMGVGMALGLKIDRFDSRVYVLLGDGELQEGQVWEAAMASAHYELDNICAIVDRNGLQIDGAVEDIMNVEPLSDKWKGFGWNVINVDGHSFSALRSAFHVAREIKGRPTVVIAKTLKGKGVSLFENKVHYHGVPPTDEELKIAIEELESCRR
ncbi:MAG: transketolase [Deltaproteobacteria bacterium]|nr:transketolase [Deltaproteobacteria bacterium]MCL5277597.1 transketolase [Deltaproteobacteria bacterium]